MKIGEALKVARNAKGLNQEDAAEKIGTSQSYLSQIEGGTKEASSDMLKKICKVYGVIPQVIIWQSLEKKDIQKKKLPVFDKLKPLVDNLISELLKP